VIDARSSRAPVKKDDVEHEKRRASTEKHKTAQDAERRKETSKNLERQALEERWAEARREGRLEEDSTDDDDDDEDNDSEGMVACLNRILQAPPQADVSSSRAGVSKRSQGGYVRVAGGRRRLATRAPTCPLPLLGVGPTYRHDLPKRPVWAIRSRPLERGR